MYELMLIVYTDVQVVSRDKLLNISSDLYELLARLGIIAVTLTFVLTMTRLGVRGIVNTLIQLMCGILQIEHFCFKPKLVNKTMWL